MNKFEYEPFTMPESEIRLLDLYPGPGVVRCRLRHVSLSASEPYEALSYCWGKPSRSFKVLVNEDFIFVRSNLHAALLHLRPQPGETARSIWIDAICIDQDNDKEKERQIPLMGPIYTQCENVVIWLGEHDWLTRTAFEGIEFLGSKPRSDDERQLEIYEYDWKRIKREDDRGQNATGPLWHFWDRVQGLYCAAAFNSIFTRPWFTRVWVIQELALCRQATVVCGSYQVDWELIDRAASVWGAFGSPMGGLRDFRDWPDGIRDDIVAHMMASWHKDAKYAKDKVYGLMGLRTSEQMSIEIDYKATDEEFFTSFTRNYIARTSNLQVLAISRGCKLPAPGSPEVELPSWVIDYQYDVNEGPLPWELFSWTMRTDEKAWTAGGNQSHIPRFDGNLLGVQGFRLDTVADVSIVSKVAATRVDESYMAAVIGSWISAVGFSRFYMDAKSIAAKASPDGTYTPTGEATADAFWQSLTAMRSASNAELGLQARRSNGGELKSRRARTSLDRILAAVGQIPMPGLVEGFVLAAFYLLVLIMTAFGETRYVEFFRWAARSKKRRFIVTERGYFGLGPREATVGDEVLLLRGHQAPVLARKDQRRRIVGDSYVHGIMYGEAFEEDRCQIMWFE
ncbi:heterokaryon incompatibility protein-domain-containing protein [Xylariaceae sp. FL0804]|nr:heterokaryon incompatibility protein-domain-containing protein [Xylariaceae sp. FL0804]